MGRAVGTLSVLLVLTIALVGGCGKGPSPPTPVTISQGEGVAPTQGPGELASTGQVVYRVADHWGEVKKFYQFRGQERQPCTKGCPSPVPWLEPGGAGKEPLINAHPAYSGKPGEVGETILAFSVRLPNQPTQLTFGAYVGRSPGQSDGVQFQVKVQGALTFDELIRKPYAQRRRVDLTAYAGKTVAIELITGPGPKGDVASDWAVWVDPVIRM